MYSFLTIFKDILPDYDILCLEVQYLFKNATYFRWRYFTDIKRKLMIYFSNKYIKEKFIEKSKKNIPKE